jgi:hypothetical protein
VLFSDRRVSAFIRNNFVAAWESVRPVPTVEIDFGNGRKLKRTVNGNIATYICAPDGRVIDIIPGLNTPEAYLRDLRKAFNLYRDSMASFEKTVLDHHSNSARIAAIAPGPKLPEISDVSKAIVEVPVKRLTAEEKALLDADTEINRKERKPFIHKILSEKVVRPAEITKRIYKEALHCDLDDPYLGLISKAFNGGAYEGH